MLRILTFSMVLACSLSLVSPAFADGKISINTATIEQLTSVSGITEEIAKKIIAYREEMGDIQSLDELLEIEGITKDLLKKVQETIDVDAVAGAECNC